MSVGCVVFNRRSFGSCHMGHGHRGASSRAKTPKTHFATPGVTLNPNNPDPDPDPDPGFGEFDINPRGEKKTKTSVHTVYKRPLLWCMCAWLTRLHAFKFTNKGKYWAKWRPKVDFSKWKWKILEKFRSKDFLHFISYRGFGILFGEFGIQSKRLFIVN